MYSAIAQQQLLSIAHNAIAEGINMGTRLTPDHDHYPANLRLPLASFITLRVEQQLRGCIGSLQANEPLIDNVAYNAYSAAFEDPRFAQLQSIELATAAIEISILSDCEPLATHSEEDLIAQLRPEIDGLVISMGQQSGTFLPAIWQQVDSPEDFFQQLKQQAGLAKNYWSDAIEVSRYTVESFRNR